MRLLNGLLLNRWVRHATQGSAGIVPDAAPTLLGAWRLALLWLGNLLPAFQPVRFPWFMFWGKSSPVRIV